MILEFGKSDLKESPESSLHSNFYVGKAHYRNTIGNYLQALNRFFFIQFANCKMTSRISLNSSKSSKPCPRKTTSYSAYEAFMRSKDDHVDVEPKIPTNQNASTYCGDGTWTWDADLNETGAGLYHDDDDEEEPFSSHITYVHPPISKDEMQAATSLSDIQPPSQISSSCYDDDFPQQLPQDQPVCSQESEDELFLRNFNPLTSAQKKVTKTKTIFSVVQSMDNRDPVLSKAKDQVQRVPSQEASLQPREQTEVKVEVNLPKKEEIPIPTSKAPPQPKVPVDTLIFHQNGLPISKAFSANIYLENATSHFIGYKVFCNFKATVLVFVTPPMGIIPPKSQVNALVKTKRLNDIVPREFSELMSGAKFMVKMFQMRDDNVTRLPVYFDMLSRERPDLIFTQVIDKIILIFPDNLEGMKSATDIAGTWENSKESVSDQDSFKNKKNNGILNKVLEANQDMRHCLSLILNFNLFQKRVTWFTFASVLPMLCLLCHLFKDYLYSS